MNCLKLSHNRIAVYILLGGKVTVVSFSTGVSVSFAPWFRTRLAWEWQGGWQWVCPGAGGSAGVRTPMQNRTFHSASSQSLESWGSQGLWGGWQWNTGHRLFPHVKIPHFQQGRTAYMWFLCVGVLSFTPQSFLWRAYFSLLMILMCWGGHFINVHFNMIENKSIAILLTYKQQQLLLLFLRCQALC